MFVTIINDCCDQGTMGRQAARAMNLLNAPVSTVGISSYAELEAAGNLIDILDASEGGEGVILVNAAPRHGRGKKWENGTPFGYFYYGKTLIVSTIAEETLSLVKKFGLASSLQLTDVPQVVDTMIERGLLASELRNRIVNSQFRSFEYMPRLAKWIRDGIDIPAKEYSFENIVDMPQTVWLVDNFGNCKTTILPSEIGHEPGKVVKTKIGEFTCYTCLRDVPNDQPGLTIGSSGLGDKRFLEIVIQGKNAAETFNLTPGSVLF